MVLRYSPLSCPVFASPPSWPDLSPAAFTAAPPPPPPPLPPFSVTLNLRPAAFTAEAPLPDFEEFEHAGVKWTAYKDDAGKEVRPEDERGGGG